MKGKWGDEVAMWKILIAKNIFKTFENFKKN